jgi:hypothetical protein
VAQRAAELQAGRGRLAGLEREVTRQQVLFLKARSASLDGKLNKLAEEDEALERAQTAMRELGEFAGFPSSSRDAVIRVRDRLMAEREGVETSRREVEERERALNGSDRVEYEALRDSVGSLSPEALEGLRAIAYAVAPAARERPGFVGRVLRGLVRFAAAVVRLVLRRPVSEAARDKGAATPSLESLGSGPSRHGHGVVTAPDHPASGWKPDPPGREGLETLGYGSLPEVSREEARALLERHTRYLTLRPVVEAVLEAQMRLRAAEVAKGAAEAELRGLLTPGVATGGDDLDAAVTGFLEGCRKHTLYEVAQAEAEEAARRRRLLLGERSPEELRAQAEECERRLEGLLGANPDLAGIEAEAGAGEIARRLERLQEERSALEIAVARLEEEVRSTLKDHRPRAEIEEDAERWRREAARLESARRAAQMARAAIAEAMVAVYRDFAPAVNEFLSDGFDYITEGRYRRAHVDPATLRVSLLVPETGRVITDPPVSRGTLTAAYILMRMGLAHHMSAIGEPVPLVLDDPFVDLDRRRLERMLEFILRITERTQVLLFTKDRHIEEWFESACGDGRHRLHHLSSLPALVPAV